MILAIQMTMTDIEEEKKVPVEDADIDEMFAYADKNCDGKLSYSEFEVTLAIIGTRSLESFSA